MELSLDRVYESLYEFIIVLMHTIFYTRKLYPRITFARVRQYDTATFQNNHPGVQSWVENAATIAVQAIRLNPAKSIAFVILENSKPTERFILDVSHLPRIDQIVDPISADALNQQYKATIAALVVNAPEELLEDDPGTQNALAEATVEKRTLTLWYEGEVTEELVRPGSLWVEAEHTINGAREHVNYDQCGGTKVNQIAQITPIRFIEAGPFSMSLFHQMIDPWPTTRDRIRKI